jgi:glycosyltransferase involved in cell wall biosynthesis
VTADNSERSTPSDRRRSYQISVAHFQRLATSQGYSVERLFDDVRLKLPADIEATVRVNRHVSEGIWGRISDAFAAWRARGEVNHVLGDVHYLAWFLPRKRTVLTVLDCVSLENMRGPRRWLFWLLWYWLPLQRVARVTVISEFTKTALQRWVNYPDDKIDIIPPPLSPEFTLAPVDPSSERCRLLQIGTSANKNVRRVVDAIAELPVTLVIVGSLREDEIAHLERLQIDYVNRVGLDRESLLEEYRRASIVVFASTYEGFGMPIIEAQAIGRPVITSNCSAMPEAAGGAACFVDPLDSADIRRGVQRVMDDPEYVQDLVKRGLKNASRFAPELVAEAYAKVYRRVYLDNE